MKRLSLIALLAVAGFANAATYELDPYHTNARFSIDHFGTSTNVAGFYELSGLMHLTVQQAKARLISASQLVA